MSFLEYLRRLKTDQKVIVFAEKCGTSEAHLFQIARGYRRAGEDLCIRIDRESQGIIRCEDLRPDVDWGYLRGSFISGDIAA